MYSFLKDHLKAALAGSLPGEQAHRKMLPPGRRLKTLPDENNRVKQSSVLVLLFPDDGHLNICLTRRPATMKNHPGQISFPGGKVEKEDLSAENTALREGREEVGINPAELEILGKLSELYVEVSCFSIQPFIAWADKRPDFRADPHEVEELIFFPVDEFVRNEIIQETEMETITGMLTVRYYPFDGKIIWGATAMILAELIEILKSGEAIRETERLKIV